jgi:D-glycero-D-manno-heptose 1,7-bisphosphate phosphatase
MKKAVFLDRDGVINRDILSYTFRLEDFIILDGTIEAMKIFRDKGYRMIVITNQGGIGRKLYGHEDVKILHDHLTSLLKAENIFLDAIYYCPHHPETSACLCRKPGSLLLEKAVARFGLVAAQSYFIGDMDRDMEAGRGAGVIPIKTETNGSLLDIVNLIR